MNADRSTSGPRARTGAASPAPSHAGRPSRSAIRRCPSPAAASRQRRADHPDRIRPPRQHADRQQHMRAPAPGAPRPPRPQPPAGPARPRAPPAAGHAPTRRSRPRTPGSPAARITSNRSTPAASLPTVSIGASAHLRRPSRRLGQKTTGRAGLLPEPAHAVAGHKKGQATKACLTATHTRCRQPPTKRSYGMTPNTRARCDHRAGSRGLRAGGSLAAPSRRTGGRGDTLA